MLSHYGKIGHRQRRAHGELMESHAEARAARTQGEGREALPVTPFRSHTTVRSGIARVTLVGELDMDTAPRLRSAVSDCLGAAPTRLRLDMTGVSFCDCAGLSALLGARTSALRVGADFVVEGVGAGTQVARLLSLIGVDRFLTGQVPTEQVPTEQCPTDQCPTDPFLTGRDTPPYAESFRRRAVGAAAPSREAATATAEQQSQHLLT
ncbi:STAS domain-containing protein [Streptomyces sp. NPDC005892]|uniref:STAS domain-containing protein n=1 Tax=Streptomyces sp. NPDC005892 TaxID=3155593 RepID=UPI0033F55CE4